jgi:hypothetical protein
MESTPPSWNSTAKMLPTTVAVADEYPWASARSRNSAGSQTSEPKATCAVSPCRTSQRFVRRSRIAGRSERLIR